MAPTVEQHFDGREPAVRDIYETIVAAARTFGPLDEDPKKTSIHLNRNSAFAGIQTRRQVLILTIKSTVDLDSPRITKREQASANRWHHEMRIGHAKEIDGEIIDWLRRFMRYPVRPGRIKQWHTHDQ